MKTLRFDLQVTCDSAAFDGAIASELARIVRDIADKLEAGFNFDKPEFVPVRDCNGNTVGTAVLREAEG